MGSSEAASGVAWGFSSGIFNSMKKKCLISNKSARFSLFSLCLKSIQDQHPHEWEYQSFGNRLMDLRTCHWCHPVIAHVRVRKTQCQQVYIVVHLVLEKGHDGMVPISDSPCVRVKDGACEGI
jgi:hypothetical protein